MFREIQLLFCNFILIGLSQVLDITLPCAWNYIYLHNNFVIDYGCAFDIFVHSYNKKSINN